MLGAIIGDLAAWTYEHNREAFFTTLLSTDAELSDYGKAALVSARAVCEDNFLNRKPNSCEPYQSDSYGPRLIQAIQFAWMERNLESCIMKAKTIESDIAEKAGLYFVNIAVEGIYSLRNGCTKYDLDEKKGGFSFNTIKNFGKKENGHIDCLSYLAWAKECLDKSWDFTSAIHEASYMEGDKHFLFSLVGALAGAMYGCHYRLLKKEYTDSPFLEIPIPEVLSEDVRIIREYEWEHRKFFPKNNAMTNSERINWKPVTSQYCRRHMSRQFAFALKRAFYPDSDKPYGFYLENGWVYVYRSGEQIARFILTESFCDTYMIFRVESHYGYTKLVDTAISEGLATIRLDY